MTCRNAARWMYKLPKNHTWCSPFTVGRDYAFQDKKGHTRLVISSEGVITVTRGYAWDGCTPKFCFMDLVIGTPDGVVYLGSGFPKTYYASLIHDALYQFLPHGFPLTRKQADQCFLQLMTESEFSLRYIYYIAVRSFGWLTLPITRRIRATGVGIRIDVT